MMPGEEGVLLKKGPWTAAEDAVLVEYVRKHGEGNWNAVQRNSGLSRCGKSCRLRWANHLRPNLKKGSFSPEEERLILELHAKLGNKWARMATQLPGRTDNEIKNYWNTRIKRRQRAGLPLYPPDIQRQAILHRRQNHHESPLMTINNQTHEHNSQFSNNNPTPLPLFDPLPINFSSPTPGHESLRCGIAPTAISVATPFIRYVNNSHSNVINFQQQQQQQQCPSFSMKVLELPSNQFSSAPTWGRNTNNGLLDALLEETVNRRKPASDLPIDTFLPKSAVQENENNDKKTTDNDDASKDPKPKAEPMEGLEPQTDDLSAFFDFMPPAAQTTATATGITWCKNVDSGEISNGQSSGVTEDDIGLEMQQLASSLSMAAAEEHTWSLGSAHWDNMPSIC